MSELQPPATERFPLNNAQSLIWLGQSVQTTVPLYNMAWRFDLHLMLDVAAFTQAFQALVDGSDAMRLRFAELNGEVFQEVQAASPIEMPVIDLSAQADAQQSLDSWLQRAVIEHIDLSKKAYTTALLKLDDQHWVWFINLHHLITDGTASILLYDRMASLYAQAKRGELAVSPSYPRYIDHVQREQQNVNNNELVTVREHWAKHAESDAHPVTLYGRNSNQHHTSNHRVAVSLGKARSQQLETLSNQPGFRSFSPSLTRFNLFATVVFAWLHRVSGESQLCLGAPAHNRLSLADRETLGLFIEVFPLDIKIHDDDSFSALYQRVNDESQRFLRYAQAGASSAELARRFNVVLNYIHGVFGEFENQQVDAQWLHPDHVDASHDLRIQIHDFAGSGDYQLYFDCSTAVFDSELRKAAPAHFLALLDAMLEDPSQPLAQVAICTEAERLGTLNTFNAAYSDQQAEDIISRFLAQAEAAPRAIAVRQDQAHLSYSELEERSRQLAHRLVESGISHDTTVGIYMPRCIDLLVAVLAVLRAGGSFVPLEASMPTKRLQHIANDANFRLLLSHQPTLTVTGVECTTPAKLLEDTTKADTASPLPSPANHALAYLIYTSGSTGQPKGVMVERSALAQYIDWAHRTFADALPSDYPLYSSISFDLTITSLFVPLISGGCVRIYPETQQPTDLSVLQVFADDAVDVVKLTPAHLALVLEQPPQVSRIRALMLGGENLSGELAERAQAIWPDMNIYNEYGPTEAVVGCMVHRFDASRDQDAVVPVGRPATHQRIYVLDAGGHPVPPGVNGELFIAGPHLARDYSGNSGLTQERFLQDPFHPGERMYRSGDLARLNQQGALQCLGRSDNQLKLRGVRIEPAEIQHAMMAYPGIRDSVVELHATQRHQAPESQHYCTRCGLSSSYPGISFNAQGVCHLCSGYEDYRDQADVYFGELSDLQKLIDDARHKATGKYDCIALLSGGKDSTYALYRVAELGPRILAITLDNGYISEGAKQNISKVVDSLGIDHRFVTTPHMKAIFSDSLERHSNVCHGCFKTIYTLAIQLALDEGIPYIVTGLSRGQFFETRLTPDLFTNGPIDGATIDRTVLQARKAYHHIDDAVSQLLDVSMFDDDSVFDKVQFIDFYRYCDVGLDEVYRFLDQQAPWIRPKDTGRSTNCLINDSGIYVHKLKEGYHNYALPYSWDVRLGHKTREEALHELNDQIDVANVQQILQEIQYPTHDITSATARQQLVAYYVADGEIDDAALRAHLQEYLLDAMVPSHLMPLEQVPLTANGKVDRSALPKPKAGRPQVSVVYQAPKTATQRSLANIWKTVLDIDRVGLADNYYALGGDSISAIHIATTARHQGIELAATDIFEHQTIAALAEVMDQRKGVLAGKANETEQAPERFSMADLNADKLARLEKLLGKGNR